MTEGNAIRISGGNYRATFCKSRCFNCRSIYEINYEQDKHICPVCGSENILCSKKTNFCEKWCKGHNIDDNI